MRGYGKHSLGVFSGVKTRDMTNGNVVLVEYRKMSQPHSALLKASWESNEIAQELEAIGWVPDFHDEYSAIVVRRYVKTETSFKLQALDDENSFLEPGPLVDILDCGVLVPLPN